MFKRFFVAAGFLAVIFFVPAASAEKMAYDDWGKPVQALEMGTVQKVSYTGTAAATSSTVGGAGTTVVRIVCTTRCYFVAGANPTATSSDNYLPADAVEYITVQSTDKMSFKRVTADGTADVTATK